jgi:phospholipid/cholesterol/gamma-HCH transport system substrate-binding protein
MSDRARNLAVGFTVIVGFVMLGAMIIAFAGVPQMFQPGYIVYIDCDAANGVSPGDPVHLRGIRVGYVTDVSFTKDQPEEGVTYTAKIRYSTHLPGNVQCWVTTGGQLSRAFVDFWPTAPAKIKDPLTGKELDDLEAASAPVRVKAISKGSGLIPENVSKKLETALDSLATLAGNLNAMIAPPPAATGPASTGPSSTTGPAPALPEGMAGLTARLSRTLDSLYAVIGDAQNQANIKASLANLNKATAGAIETMDAVKNVAANADKTFHDVSNLTTRANDDIHTLSQKLVADAEDISKLMTSLNKAGMALNSKEGSMGKLLNDPELYNSLLEVSKGMNTLVKDLDALIKQWKEQGVNMKLK